MNAYHELEELNMQEWEDLCRCHPISLRDMEVFQEGISDEVDKSSFDLYCRPENTKKSFICSQCEKHFTRKYDLERHMKTHTRAKEYGCNFCTRMFYRKDKLQQHQAICQRKAIEDQCTAKQKIANEVGANGNSVMGHDDRGGSKAPKNFVCARCNKHFKRKFHFKRHTKIHAKEKDFQCSTCSKTFHRRDKKVQHERSCRRMQIGDDRRDVSAENMFKAQVGGGEGSGEDRDVENHECESALNGNLNIFQMKPRINEKYDLSIFLQGKKANVSRNLQRELELKKGVKWFICVHVKMIKYRPEGEDEISTPHFRSNCERLLHLTDLSDQYHESVEKIKESFQAYQREGSGWQLKEVLKLDLGVAVYTPLHGSSYIKLPKTLKDKKAILNVQNDDQKCFLWSVLAALHPVNRKDHNITDPMKKSSMDLSRLLRSLTKYKCKKFFCEYCLHGFVREDLLLEHEPLCAKNGPQKIKLPDEDHDVLYFKDVQKQLKVPFVIYADFESILVSCDEQQLDPSVSFTQKTQEHKPSGFCYTVVSEVEAYDTPPIVYRGEDAVDKFLEHLLQEEKRIKGILEHVVPMSINNNEEQAFQRATHCHICDEELHGTDRTRDHCHLTGKYRGAAHFSCNLNFKFSNRIPVVLYNLRGYDSHLIMQGLGKLKGVPITCIPNNSEKYISFSVGDLVFIDSLQFMNASLEKLVSNLAKEGDDKFRVLKKYTPADKVPLLLRKGVYPYEYVDSFQKFQETKLPPMEAFFSSLKNEEISEEDYAHAQTVFAEFQCRSLGDYHDLYLKSDDLLLSDIFQNFRDICLNYYHLDPAQFYTSPGLSWAACLKMTGVELELLTDPDMYIFIEQGIRGGISMISNRYSKANNPYVAGYDKDQETNFILYVDANNLYGWAMSRSLPVGGFVWLNEDEIADLDVLDIADDSEEGCILEVDLEYPCSLHDRHNDYPLAPERLVVKNDMLSPYCEQLVDELQLKSAQVAKLVPNLNNKTKYVIHYQNLKLYLSLGMKLTNIHRVLRFQQSPWLKSYIDFNTEKRKLAANDFEKDFFKLMNNSVFGKTMENLRKRVNVKLVNNEKQLKKLTASPSFDYFRIFSNELAAVNMKKPTLYLNRPIYVGFAILDLSKTLMYDFHYNYIKKKYDLKATLLFTDTDSLCYSIQTKDIYRDIQEDSELFDTSEYSRGHFLFSTENKKVLGKMKDGTHGIPIEEFVGLRPKMYSLLYTENCKTIEKKVAKGIAKNVTKKEIRHQHYKDCLFNRKQQMASMHQIRSFQHNVYSIKLNKIGLSPFDDKRHITSNGRDSLAYGHYTLRDSNLDQHDQELIELLVNL
ncbi:hypothetical protein ACROYT_G043851 [Oculina patagonica]